MSLDHTKNIIEVKDVSFSYGNVPVLKNITLTIHQGDYVGVIGPNGSGKTTLLKAIAGIRAGRPAAEVDQLARKYLAKHRLEKFFGHSLGHGVGLDIHESPRLSQSSPAVLKEGMVVTVEPAAYIPNKFGIRIEDMVLVKKDNCEVLSGNIDH